ncbi:hypothetical protein EB796_015096 [Bugula neritina]|uniref:Uncharacterized protein n=1 Tax=Bugula neritina TaxID=10212 RepID=A0A7J7JL61_BUGNE|nr:hypothetical protein EB796_015096 [Bugula neritina]
MNADTFLIPFFPPVAKEKGISDTEIGIVFSAFEFSKLVSYVPNQAYLPLCIIVRMIAGCGSACIVVCGMSILLKATSYSNSTIIGFTWSLMILAWCVSIFINLFTGPSPLLDFIFHGKQ